MNNLKTYIDKNLQNNYEGLLEALKYNLQPMDGNPYYKTELLQINSSLNEGKNIYQEINSFLGNEKYHFIKKLFICKTNENFFADLLNVEFLISVVYQNLYSDDNKKIIDSLSTLGSLTNESSRTCNILMFHNESLDLWLKVLKV